MRISKFNTKSRSDFQGGCRESNVVVIKSSRWLATVATVRRSYVRTDVEKLKWPASGKRGKNYTKKIVKAIGKPKVQRFPWHFYHCWGVRNNNYIHVGKATEALNQMFVKLTDWCLFNAGAIDPLIQFDEWYSSNVARTFAANIGDRTYSHNINSVSWINDELVLRMMVDAGKTSPPPVTIMINWKQFA